MYCHLLWCHCELHSKPPPETLAALVSKDAGRKSRQGGRSGSAWGRVGGFSCGHDGALYIIFVVKVILKYIVGSCMGN